MAGQLCSGHTQKNGVPNESKAYCEGMAYRASDTAVNAPKTDNPHLSGSDAADSWDAGWDIAHAAAGGVIDIADQGCCAVSNTVPI